MLCRYDPSQGFFFLFLYRKQIVRLHVFPLGEQGDNEPKYDIFIGNIVFGSRRFRVIV